MEPEITNGLEYIDKSQEKAIWFFYKFLIFKGVKLDGDIMDDFFDWYALKRENQIILEEMEELTLKKN